eukprot:TRINITY_DN13143_c0_g2_i1.p1 TRINITY_DN13143_c0_g2~~TRINITY_DN13143_c0_g2_i1.p1  ORF type:complete len:296 (-),score=23.90 TRINITY_DN13143_c0_g2_i1:96-983(-)
MLCALQRFPIKSSKKMRAGVYGDEAGVQIRERMRKSRKLIEFPLSKSSFDCVSGKHYQSRKISLGSMLGSTEYEIPRSKNFFTRKHNSRANHKHSAELSTSQLRLKNPPAVSNLRFPPQNFFCARPKTSMQKHNPHNNISKQQKAFNLNDSYIDLSNSPYCSIDSGRGFRGVHGKRNKFCEKSPSGVKTRPLIVTPYHNQTLRKAPLAKSLTRDIKFLAKKIVKGKHDGNRSLKSSMSNIKAEFYNSVYHPDKSIETAAVKLPQRNSVSASFHKRNNVFIRYSKGVPRVSMNNDS